MRRLNLIAPWMESQGDDGDWGSLMVKGWVAVGGKGDEGERLGAESGNYWREGGGAEG